MNTETTFVLAVVTVFGGLGALIQSGWTLFTILRWQRARATVLRYRVSVGDGGRFFHPVYRFQGGRRSGNGDLVLGVVAATVESG